MRKFITELRRRRVFQTAAVYVVGAWLILQVADVLFPGWGLSDAAVNVLFVASVVGFPLALVFGWFFDVTTHGIVRTPSVDEEGGTGPAPLRRSDFVVLAALVLVAGVIVYDAATDIAETPRTATGSATEDPDPLVAERPDNSIAVLPFANVSSDPENEFFCDGISEEILHKLAAFGDLHVIGRQSSFAFKGSDYRIPRISALLGVQYLLQGSVRKYGDQLRITAQLVDQSGDQIWSEAFDRRLADIFAIQTEIADVVATTVVPRIVPRQVPVYEPDLTAYRHYLAGREYVHQRDIIKARQELARAIEIDPEFAEAQAEYAIAELIFFSGGPDDLARIRAAIDRAFELRPGLVRAKAAEGLYLMTLRSPDFESAAEILREAIAGDPSMSDAYNWLGGALSALGKDDDAFALTEQGVRIDPMHPSLAVNLASGYDRKGEPERAEAIYLRLASLPEPSSLVLWELISFYTTTGRLVDANAWAYRLALVVGPESGFRAARYTKLAQTHAQLGDMPTAMRWIERGRQAVPEPGSIAWILWAESTYLDAVWAGRYREAMTRLSELIAGLGGDLAQVSPHLVCEKIVLSSLAGEHAQAIRTAALISEEWDDSPAARCNDDGELINLALAWSRARDGATDQARALLDRIEERGSELDQKGVLNRSDHLHAYALVALLAGDREAALDRLQGAIDAGWRQYYLTHHDPRWQSLSDDPRYRRMMMDVKADVDRQRADVMQIETEAELPALMEHLRALREAG
jgi:TolB-like protein/Tfp pilus assembly protein PilF